MHILAEIKILNNDYNRIERIVESILKLLLRSFWHRRPKSLRGLSRDIMPCYAIITAWSVT